MTKDTKRRPKPVFFRAFWRHIFSILIVAVLLTVAGLVANIYLNGLEKTKEAASAQQTNNAISVILIIAVAVVALLLFLQKIAPIDAFLSRKFSFLDVVLVASSISGFLYALLIDLSSQSFPVYKGCWATIPAIVTGLITVLLLGIRWAIIAVKMPRQVKMTLSDFLNLEHISDDDFKTIAICDSPSDEDLLERSIPKNKLACAINASRHVPNWVIGVTGGWGYGKTTIINQVLDELDDRKFIVVKNFNIWSYEDRNSMLSGMLRCIMEGLGMRVNTRSTQREVASFVDAVCSTSGVNAKFSALFDGPTDNAAFLKRVSDLLSYTKKRMVFVVDDLDRCPEDLTKFAFITVASILNINNITFLMVFDEPRVDKIVNAGQNKDFTNKIIHVKIPIAPPDRKQVAELCMKTYELIGVKLDEKETDCLKELFKDIKDLRELTRLLNAFFMDLSINRDQSKNGVYLYKRDMLVASYIKMFNPGLEEELRNARNLLSKTSFSGEEYTKRLNIPKWAKLLVNQKDSVKELTEKRMSSPVYFDSYFAESYAGIPMAVNLINETIKNDGEIGKVIDQYYRESDARTILNALLFSKDVWTEKAAEDITSKLLPFLKQPSNDGKTPIETAVFALALEALPIKMQKQLLHKSFSKDDLWIVRTIRLSYLKNNETIQLFDDIICELFEKIINAKKSNLFSKHNYSYNNAAVFLYVGYQSQNKDKMDDYIQRSVESHPENVMRIIGSGLGLFTSYSKDTTTFGFSNDPSYNVISCFSDATKQAIDVALKERAPAKNELEKAILNVWKQRDSDNHKDYPLAVRPSDKDWRKL